ncbi:TetR/AcrR family transcriptional regulator [Pseudoroseomonas cervicalis]|uniref:TetR/AcrR family transcriptional regulator n=1 Tax=Teichococcus cervicalis TaxID=204525 RepID=UPI0027803250|nr:TetR/AcrR family transcriptional regulator [Pseudoroseomonas cervicalis]MDQ1078486.1 AcrR family transcriptional regulator [Pseudoroseomonas cervicalis]
MEKRAEILATAEAVFDGGGFRGTGIDAVLAPAGVSTRTLYKHFGARDALVLAVLEARHRRFLAWLEDSSKDADPVAALFDTLRDWLAERGARGCLLLRARAEYAGANPEIVSAVRRQKAEFRAIIADRVAAALGRREDTLATQIWLLFEGATAAASVADLTVLEAAKQAAAALLRAAGPAGA